MGKSLRVSDRSGVGRAVQFAEEFAAQASDGSEARVCPLICEELLVSLLNRGCTDIRVASGGLFLRHIEISARGERTEMFPRSLDAPADRITSQINTCLLEHYADYYTYRYYGNINTYRIFAAKQDSMELSGEIYAFYEKRDIEGEDDPLAVLWHIAGNHKAFLSFSIFILLLKHLAALMLPVFVSNIINIVTERGDFFIWPVYANILMSITALMVNLICYWIDSRFYRRFTRSVEAGLRMALVRKLQVLSMQYHTRAQSGVVLSKVASDVQFIQMLLYDRFMEVLYFCEDVLFIIIVALTTFPLMLVFYIVILPLFYFLLRHFSGPLQESRAGMRHQNEQVNAAVKEMLELEGLTRSHGLQKTEYRNISRKVKNAQQAAVLYDRRTVVVNNVTYGGFQGLRLLSLSFAALLTAGGYINVGTLVLFQSIFDLMINNVQRMLDAVPLITQGYDSLVSVNEILNSDDISQNGTELLPEPVRGEIEFKNVSFGYEEGKAPVLQDISFKVPAGGSAAFVGKSGEGKTTIMSLLLGLYSPRGGEILIDGVNLDLLDKNEYRRNIAVVPQNTVLFSGTLWDNLVYGLNYVSTEKVMDVINRAGLRDFLESLPEGLNTPVQENGGNLSGGQRQRISIARALLREPKIILLDEATSALDSISERQVQDAIDAMMGGCTVIMVSHRLSTLRRADTVYRIDRGTLVSYEDLDRVIADME